MKKLNLGCGDNKLFGFINIDVEASCKPDVICDFTKNKLPYRTGSVDEVVMFHVIEHINKRSHKFILGEVWRVLRAGGTLLISYPEFLKCVENWTTNFRGQRDFWEATLYGRQLYPSDTHVCIMHTPDFKETLEMAGFASIYSTPELSEDYNTVIHCVKGVKPPVYLDLLKDYMNRVEVKKA